MIKKLKNRCTVTMKQRNQVIGTFRPTQKLFYSLQKELEPHRTIYDKKCYIILKQEKILMGKYRVDINKFNKIREKIERYKSEGYPSKKVKCIETGEIFKNARAASSWVSFVKEYGYNKANSDLIKQCCRGKQKTSYGYHWEFVDKAEKKSD